MCIVIIQNYCIISTIYVWSDIISDLYLLFSPLSCLLWLFFLTFHWKMQITIHKSKTNTEVHPLDLVNLPLGLPPESSNIVSVFFLFPSFYMYVYEDSWSLLIPLHWSLMSSPALVPDPFPAHTLVPYVFSCIGPWSIPAPALVPYIFSCIGPWSIPSPYIGPLYLLLHWSLIHHQPLHWSLISSPALVPDPSPAPILVPYVFSCIGPWSIPSPYIGPLCLLLHWSLIHPHPYIGPLFPLLHWSLIHPQAPILVPYVFSCIGPWSIPSPYIGPLCLLLHLSLIHPQSLHWSLMSSPALVPDPSPAPILVPYVFSCIGPWSIPSPYIGPLCLLHWSLIHPQPLYWSLMSPTLVPDPSPAPTLVPYVFSCIGPWSIPSPYIGPLCLLLHWSLIHPQPLHWSLMSPALVPDLSSSPCIGVLCLVLRECPSWCPIVGATGTVHQFFCILHSPALDRGEVNWLFNVTINDISVIYICMWRICARPSTDTGPPFLCPRPERPAGGI